MFLQLTTVEGVKFLINQSTIGSVFPGNQKEGGSRLVLFDGSDIAVQETIGNILEQIETIQQMFRGIDHGYAPSTWIEENEYQQRKHE